MFSRGQNNPISNFRTNTQILDCRNMLPLAEKFCFRNPSCPWLVTPWPLHLLPPLQICQCGLDVNWVSEISCHKSPLFFLSLYTLGLFLSLFISSLDNFRAPTNSCVGRRSREVWAPGTNLFCNTALVWLKQLPDALNCGVPFTSESNISIPQALQSEWERMRLGHWGAWSNRDDRG